MLMATGGKNLYPELNFSRKTFAIALIQLNLLGLQFPLGKTIIYVTCLFVDASAVPGSGPGRPICPTVPCSHLRVSWKTQEKQVKRAIVKTE
jgi:hypothetical protein